MRIRLVPSKARARAVQILGNTHGGHIDDLEVLDEVIAMCKKQRVKPVFWKRDCGVIIEYTLQELIEIRYHPEATAGEDVRPEK